MAALDPTHFEIAGILAGLKTNALSDRRSAEPHNTADTHNSSDTHNTTAAFMPPYGQGMMPTIPQFMQTNPWMMMNAYSSMPFPTFQSAAANQPLIGTPQSSYALNLPAPCSTVTTPSAGSPTFMSSRSSPKRRQLDTSSEEDDAPWTGDNESVDSEFEQSGRRKMRVSMKPTGLVGTCDSCFATNAKLVSKVSRYNPKNGKANLSFLKTNPETGEQYNVCIKCWDKVKNCHSGCRIWVHAEMERTDPGVVDRYRDAIRMNGVDSQEYRDFEKIFDQHFERYLKVRNLNATEILKRLRQVTHMPLNGMLYEPRKNKRTAVLEQMFTGPR